MRFTPAHPRRWLGVAAITTTLLAALGTPAAAIPAEAQILHTGGPTAVTDSYIVVFKDTAVGKADVAKTARDLAHKHGGTVARTYQHALRGFEARMPEAAAKRLAANPNVKYVEQNHTVRAESPVLSWGQDRIDQRDFPLDSYYYPSPVLFATGVKAYVIDTGIRATHFEFQGRAISGFDATDGVGFPDDCNGHGTHVAGIIGGGWTGVAKNVTLVPVRVFDCMSSSNTAATIAGVNWVTGDHQTGELAVANMSLTVTGYFSQSVNDAVANSIADGITYVAAAGNENWDACGWSPASLPAAITVGATTSTDARLSWSNYGTCLDLFAPGHEIYSAWDDSDISYNVISGTSMAAAHVTGAAALVLAANPYYTPQQVRDHLVTNATNGRVTNPGPGSPNKLLYVGGCSTTNDTDVPIPDNTTVESAITISDCYGNAGSHSTVAVTIAHSTVSDLVVRLIAPDGTAYTLHNRTGGSINDINQTYKVDLSSEAKIGTWKLRVQDAVSGEVGYIDTWTLDPIGTSYACGGSNGTDVPIPDNNTAVESAITAAGCPGNALTNSTVFVFIVHPYIGDLVVRLIAPDGTAYTLHNRAGGDTDNIIQAYTGNLSSEVANGTWKLRVQDAGSGGTGYIDTWSLTL